MRACWLLGLVAVAGGGARQGQPGVVSRGGSCGLRRCGAQRAFVYIKIYIHHNTYACVYCILSDSNSIILDIREERQAAARPTQRPPTQQTQTQRAEGQRAETRARQSGARERGAVEHRTQRPGGRRAPRAAEAARGRQRPETRGQRATEGAGSKAPAAARHCHCRHAHHSHSHPHTAAQQPQAAGHQSADRLSRGG
jgi:hypothetical protein